MVSAWSLAAGVLSSNTSQKRAILPGFGNYSEVRVHRLVCQRVTRSSGQEFVAAQQHSPQTVRISSGRCPWLLGRDENGELEADDSIVGSHEIGEIVCSGELGVDACKIGFGDLTGPRARQSNVYRNLRFDQLIEQLAERRESDALDLVDDLTRQHVHRFAHHDYRGLVATLERSRCADERHGGSSRIVGSVGSDVKEFGHERPLDRTRP